MREAFRREANARDRIGRTHLGQIRHTDCEPVEITRHGRLAFVLTLAEHYERMKALPRARIVSLMRHRCGDQDDLPRHSLGRDDSGDVTNRVVQVERLQIESLFVVQQVFQAEYDLAGALIVPDNGGKDFANLPEVERVGLQQGLRSLGIAKDGSKGLIQLMGDRRRQSTRGGNPVQANDLRAATACFHLRKLPAAALEEPCLLHARICMSLQP